MDNFTSSIERYRIQAAVVEMIFQKDITQLRDWLDDIIVENKLMIAASHNHFEEKNKLYLHSREKNKVPRWDRNRLCPDLKEQFLSYIQKQQELDKKLSNMNNLLSAVNNRISQKSQMYLALPESFHTFLRSLGVPEPTADTLVPPPLPDSLLKIYQESIEYLDILSAKNFLLGN